MTPVPGLSYTIDRETQFHDGREPYVKVGRKWESQILRAFKLRRPGGSLGFMGRGGNYKKDNMISHHES